MRLIPTSHHARRRSSPLADRKASRSQSAKSRLTLECLEDRTLLSIAFTPGPLTVPNTSGADTALGQISGFRPVEPFFSVNPVDPSQIAVSTHNGLVVSTNGGGTFSGVSFFPGSTGGDTGTVYDHSGRLFWVNIGGAGISIVQVNPSTGGILAGPFNVDNGGGADDKPFIAADPNNNNLYVIWTALPTSGGSQILLRRSTNQGVTWSAPVRVDNGADGFVWPASVAVGPNGFVYASYHSLLGFSGSNPDHTGKIVVVRYNNDLTNPLRTLAENQGWSDITYNVQTSPQSRVIAGMQFWTQGAGQPQILPDPARPGNVYVVSADTPSTSSEQMLIRIDRSTNNGASWLSSGNGTAIEIAPGGAYAMFPQASIDQFGNIVVAWYDNRRGLRNAANRFKLDVFAKYSTDGGVTFSSDFMVNNAANPFDPDIGAINRFPGPPPTTRIGEYFGLGIFGGTAYVDWNGDQGTTSEQVFFKSFAIRGSLTVTGTPGNDTITVRSSTGNTGFVEAVVNGQRQYAGRWDALSRVTIAQTGGNDIDNIENAVAGTPFTVNMSTSAGTVNISPTAENLDNIQDVVHVNGATSGVDTLNVFDNSNSRAGTSYTMIGSAVTGSAVQRSGAAEIGYNTLMNFVNLHGGSGADTYTVFGTSAINQTQLTTGLSGSDTVNIQTTSPFSPLDVVAQALVIGPTINIGNGGGVQGIQGQITLENPPSYSNINVNDSADGTARNVTLSQALINGVAYGQIAGLAPALIDFKVGDTNTVTISGGSGGNTFTVGFTTGLGATTINAGAGGNTVNVQDSVAPLVINTGVSDSVNISSTTNTLDGIGNITINDSVGPGTTVVIDDSGFGGAEDYALTAASGVTIGRNPNFALVGSYLATSTWQINGGQGGDTFDIDYSPGFPITLNGGASMNCFHISPFTQYLAGSIFGPLTLNGTGSDVLDFFDQNDPSSETFTFDATPSSLTINAGTIATFSGMGGGIYVETNGFSTVNDASGTVNVDVPPPCIPGGRPAPSPIDGGAPFDNAQQAHHEFAGGPVQSRPLTFGEPPTRVTRHAATASVNPEHIANLDDFLAV